MGYPHFSGDCGDYHDIVQDWGRDPQEPIKCPVAPEAHHSYRRDYVETDGTEHWVCAGFINDPPDGKECGATFTRGPDTTFIPEGIVTLCGSSRFYQAYQEVYYQLTMDGWIVLSIGFYPHASAEHGHGEGVGHDSQQKVMLDQLHLRKIDLSNRVHVINLEGYIGASTRAEIEYALKRGKQVTYMEGEG